MRLINARTLELESFDDEATRPKYAILSHRWIDKQEVTFHEFTSQSHQAKAGWEKINFCCEEALVHKLEWVWVDTCCIDKTSSAELSEAINSMFKWYESAAICIVYLNDVYKGRPSDLRRSLWFQRAWTLQELIAPSIVRFYNSFYRFIGTKTKLLGILSLITTIPEAVLKNPEKTHGISIAHRMSWAATRKATRIEDAAYSLFGLFEVNLPLLYGEGNRAFTRLQQEIIRQSNDQSIFFWNSPGHGFCPLFATAPADFLYLTSSLEARQHMLENLHRTPTLQARPFALTNIGLHIDCRMIRYGPRVYLAWAGSKELVKEQEPCFFLVRKRTTSDIWCRVKLYDIASCTVKEASRMPHRYVSKLCSMSDTNQSDFRRRGIEAGFVDLHYRQLQEAQWTKIYIELKPQLDDFDFAMDMTFPCIYLDLATTNRPFMLTANFDWKNRISDLSKKQGHLGPSANGSHPSIYHGWFPMFSFQVDLAGAMFFEPTYKGIRAILIGFDDYLKPSAIIVPENAWNDFPLKKVKQTSPFMELDHFCFGPPGDIRRDGTFRDIFTTPSHRKEYCLRYNLPVVETVEKDLGYYFHANPFSNNDLGRDRYGPRYFLWVAKTKDAEGNSYWRGSIGYRYRPDPLNSTDEYEVKFL